MNQVPAPALPPEPSEPARQRPLNLGLLILAICIGIPCGWGAAIGVVFAAVQLDLGLGLVQIAAGAALASAAFATLYFMPVQLLGLDTRLIDRFTIIGAGVHAVSALAAAVYIGEFLLGDWIATLFLVLLPVGVIQDLCWRVLLFMRRAAMPNIAERPEW